MAINSADLMYEIYVHINNGPNGPFKIVFSDGTSECDYDTAMRTLEQYRRASAVTFETPNGTIISIPEARMRDVMFEGRPL